MAVAVIVEEKIKEGQTGVFVDYMREMIALTKAEDGCVAYDLYESDTGAVVMLEIWESKEALDKHMQTEHFKKFVPGGGVYKDGQPNIRILNRL